jgi:hypothetical protein
MTREPDLRELVGDDLRQDEETRLRRVHDLLVAAGPPPELPPALERAPVPGTEREARVLGLPARHRGRVLTLALGFAAVTLFVGYLFGAHRGGFNTQFSVQMSATPAAPGAGAVIDLQERDDVGNWPIRLKVHGLPTQPAGRYYELFLTRPGKPRATCGTFRVHSGTTTVRLNAPYKFTRPYGWVIVAQRPGKPESPPLLRVTV